MGYLELALAAPVILSAYFVRGLTGFGSALIAVPVLCLSLPIEIVVPSVIALDFLGSLAQGIHKRQSIHWDEIARLLPFSVAGIAIALYLLQDVDTRFLLRGLGVFIIAYSIYQLLPQPSRSGSHWYAAPAGVFGGLTGTLFATGGPFYVTYLMLRGLDKTAFRSTFAALFVIDGGLRIGGFAATGLYQADTLSLLSLLLPFAAVGLFLGSRVHADIRPEAFKMLISILLLTTSVPLLLR
ncbi:MAG TPA: sulfite exporter TauE/SafE family protein [Chromatiaceae bacterium]|jgi:uncharacterized membrane protein YfcA|nr:sulfite exporter TauE/SafE family protein [Chromatiaceae bacterium]HIN83066.1 sulfite exporter TauE/SafE family protein [Chromatiales bacterium]HIA08411.1 sulfite exporter TauE/SafE family protein [Chromatiaceae bacterium]HIB84048.1 sulfite exporter TauE/SafE family protein [Chromatiaceae bacterium]HIO13749.1 sulfite exporter TauE/SafE family protein [Chromatiales bacterium]